MSAIKVVPTSALEDHVSIRPVASPFLINERPPSRQLSKTIRLLSPKLGHISLDHDLHRSRESGSGSSERSFRRSKSEPQFSQRRSTQSTESVSNGRSSVSSFDHHQRAQDSTSFLKDRHLTGLVKLENNIRDTVRRKYSDMKMAFQMLDKSKDETVSTSDFRRVVSTFVYGLSNDQLDHIIAKIGVHGDDVVNYIMFLETFRIGPVLISEVPPVTLVPPRTAESLEGIETKLREKLAPNISGFMKAVRLYDYNRDGHVQKHELKRILNSFGIKLKEYVFNKLLQRYSMSLNFQSVNYMDLLRNLGIEPKSPEIRQKSPATQNLFLDRPSNGRRSSQMNGDDIKGLSLGQIEKKFRERIVKKYMDLQRAFIAFDKKRDGCVTLNELKRVLTHFLFPMSDEIFAQLMERCGINASHSISYGQFLSKFKHSSDDGNGQTIPIRPSHKVNPIREAISPMEMEELWQRLHNHIVNNYSSAKKAFLSFDDDKDGRVRRKEFRKVLDTFPFQISDEQFDKLMLRVDPEGKGYVSYHEFLHTFESKEGEGAHPWLYAQRRLNITKPALKMNKQQAHDILREKLMDNWKTISKAFMKIDENSDGFISKSELKFLLHRYHIPITEDQFTGLWKQCDENRDGKIHYDEFFRTLGVDITPGDVKGFSTRITDESEEKIQLMKTDQQSRQHAASKNAMTRTTEMNADEVIDVLKDHFIQRSADLRKTFLKYDYDGDGKLSRKEFRLTLQNLGLLMQSDQFKELTDRLGFYQGTMSYSDFVTKFQEIDKFGEGGKTLHMHNHRFNKVKERSETMTAEEVEEIMRKKITESFQTIRQAFYTVDSNHDGQITRPELRRLLDMFMIPIDDSEFDKLMSNNLKIPKNGTISYREFVQRFQQNENFQKGHPWLFTHQSPNTTYALKNLTAQEAHSCMKSKAIDQWRDVSMAFRAFDKDGNSVITKQELKAILHRFNIAIGKDEFKKLWRMYDTDKNGHVDYTEFLHRLGVELAPGDLHGISNKITKGSEDEIYRHHQNQQMKQHKAAMNQANTTSFMSAMDVENKLRDKFRDNYASFRKAFEQMDTNRDGLISRSELMKVLFEHHFYMNDSELIVLLNRLGFGGKDHLSYLHFLSAFEDPRYSKTQRVSPNSPRPGYTSRASVESFESLSPEEAVVKLRRSVSQNVEAIRNAFGAFDQSDSGRISIEDLHRIIDSFCFKISQKQFKHLLSKMVVQADNTVDYESFMESFQKTDIEASKKWLENMLQGVKSVSSRSVKIAPLSYEVVEGQIGAMVKAKSRKLLQVFSELDFDHTGTIEPGAFRQVLEEHTLRLADNHFQQFCNKFDSNGNGGVNYKELLKHFGANETDLEYSSNQDSSPRVEADDKKDTPLQRPEVVPINNNVNSQPLSSTDAEELMKPQIRGQWKSISKLCRAVDKSNSGEINIPKFKDVLDANGVIVGDEEFDSVMQKYDVENTGRINYLDLMKKYMMQSKDEHVGVPKSFESNDVYLNMLVGRIKNEVKDEWKALRRMFKASDRGATGNCSATELKQTLRKFKILINDEELYHLMTHFDKEMTGKVQYNEFLKALLT